MSKKKATSKPKTNASGPPTRGGMKSLRSSDSFRAFVLDQLSGVAGLQAKPMFGGLGLYAGDVFFGIVAADVLYLKVGDANRADFVRAGSAAFKPFKDRPVSMNYFNVPVAVLEDPAALKKWAAGAITVARSK